MRNQGFQIPDFLHMDNELVTNAMKDFCLEEGVELESSNPDKMVSVSAESGPFPACLGRLCSIQIYQ
jgi:hypothetical protein